MLSICSSVRLSVAKMRTQKSVFFSQKLRNLELWSLLTTNRKSYMMFRKNVFWTPNNFNNNFNNNFFESDYSPEHWPSHSCSTSSIFIARSNADTRYWVEQLCLSVCPSVCPSRSGIVSKRLNISSQFLHDTVAQSSYTVRIITWPPSFKRHNLVNIRFIYMKISGNIAEGMLSLQIWK